jgi:hypothetical protein
MIAASDSDVVGWGCPLVVVLLLALLVAVFMCVRLWRWVAPVTRCPRCNDEPDIVDLYNRCVYCGCEYDKWGNFLKEQPPPPQLDAFDLAPFRAECKQTDPGDDRYRRPGLTQEPSP